MDIEAWLRGLGLERYEPAFRDNEIDWEVLPKLTSDDLREIGVTAIGHRRKLLEAIAAIGATVPTALSAASNAPPPTDAERAVRAGLAVIDAVGRLIGPEPLNVRLGIASGLVVVGDLIGTGSAREQAIVGETPNLAARLQALADPNVIVIADRTRRQIGALFEIADLGPQPLKGFIEPQRAWRVIAEARGLSRFEALRSRAVPLVGRDEDLDLLTRRWGEAEAGDGRIVLISAEPGIGKSRLIDALIERICRPTPYAIALFLFATPSG